MELFNNEWIALLAQAESGENYPLPPTVRIFLLMWVAMFGGCIGSFLNVVVYRLPRGRNLSRPGSACPSCGHAIRPWHNIPVFGWLMLRGRCYDCQTPISPRYPLVEAVVMIFVVLLAWAGPLAPDEAAISAWRWLTFSSQWLLVAYFAILLCTLLAFVLIEFDGNSDGKVRYPYSMLVFALAFGIGEPLVEPLIQLPSPQAFYHYADEPTQDVIEQVQSRSFSRATAFLNATIGGLVGLALGLASWPAWRLGPMGDTGRPFVVGTAAICGVYLGPTALPVLLISAVLAIPIALFSVRWLPSRRIPFSIALVPIVLYHVVDRTPATWIWRPYVYPPFEWVGWAFVSGVIIFLAAAAYRGIAGRRH